MLNNGDVRLQTTLSGQQKGKGRDPKVYEVPHINNRARQIHGFILGLTVQGGPEKIAHILSCYYF